jgi:hypothetical protein
LGFEKDNHNRRSWGRFFYRSLAPRLSPKELGRGENKRGGGGVRESRTLAGSLAAVWRDFSGERT